MRTTHPPGSMSSASMNSNLGHIDNHQGAGHIFAGLGLGNTVNIAIAGHVRFNC